MKKKSIVFILSMILFCTTVAVFSACKKKKAPTYHIYYSGGDGATGRAPEPAAFRAGDTVTLVENVFFQRAEYAFTGWKVLEQEYSVGDSFAMPASDVTIDACWTQLATLIYSFGENSHAAFGCELPASVRQKIGTDVTLPAVEAESGYSFAGWVATGESFPRAAGSKFTLARNVTLTAKWSAWGQVTYDANGGMGVDPAPIAYAAGDTVFIDENPYQRRGYRFVGWSVTANGNTVTVREDDGRYYFTMPEGGAVVSALWKEEHTITYSYGEVEANHGTGIVPLDLRRYVEGDAVALSSQEVTAARGWRFDGWSVSCASSGTPISVSSDAFVMPDDDVVVTAQWSLITYSVVYERSASSSDKVVEEITVESNGGKLVLKDATLFEAQGSTFSGWRIGETNYAAGAVVDILEILPESGTVITVTAQWSDFCRAEYSFGEAGNAHGTGSVPVDFKDYTAGDTVKLYSGAVSAEKGWRFLGWAVTKKSDGTLVSVSSGADGDSFIMPAGGVLITAQWTEIEYTIVYLRGAHSAEEFDFTERVTVSDNGGQYALHAAYAAADTHRFAGWLLGDTLYSEGEEVSLIELIPDEGEEIVFTAQWDELFRVTFDLSGGNWDGTALPLVDCIVTAGTLINFAHYDEPQRAGYVFKGWLVSDAADGTVYRQGTSNGVYTVTAHTEFRAQWGKAITVKFYDGLENLNAHIAPLKTIVVEEGTVIGDVFPDLGMQVTWFLTIKVDGVYEFDQMRVHSAFLMESSYIHNGDNAVYICASYDSTVSSFSTVQEEYAPASFVTSSLTRACREGGESTFMPAPADRILPTSDSSSGKTASA